MIRVGRIIKILLMTIHLLFDVTYRNFPNDLTLPIGFYGVFHFCVYTVKSYKRQRVSENIHVLQ